MSAGKERKSGGSAAAAADKVRAILEAAEQSAAELRAEAAEEIEAQLKRAQAAAERLSARADRSSGRSRALPSTVRDELTALKLDLEELRAVSERAGATRGERDEPVPVVEEPVVEEAAEVAPVVEEPAPPRRVAGAAPGARGRRPRGGSRDRAEHGAERVVPRRDGRYLAENFELEDPEALLDEVYARVS